MPWHATLKHSPIRNGSATSSQLALSCLIPALLAAQAHVNRNIAPTISDSLPVCPATKTTRSFLRFANFAEFAHHVLGWDPGDLVAIPQEETLPVVRLA